MLLCSPSFLLVVRSSLPSLRQWEERPAPDLCRTGPRQESQKHAGRSRFVLLFLLAHPEKEKSDLRCSSRHQPESALAVPLTQLSITVRPVGSIGTLKPR